MLTRPDLAEVLRYREHVDEAMHALIARQAGDAAFDALLALGLNHEQQHQELILTDIKHLLYANPLRPAYAANDAPALPPATPAGWTEYAGGVTRIGHDGGGFAFDNEGPAHDTLLGRFHLANRLVTQHEYLAFIRDGGYSRPELWLSQGWDRVCAEGWRAPLYWEGRDDWQVFTLHGMQELELQAPVTHVSYFEADAYARWAGSGCRASPNGNPPRAASLTAAPACTPTCWKAATWIRDPRPPGQAGRAPPNSTATPGSGPAAPTRPIPASARTAARWENTTANSCAINTCCAAAPASRRAATSGPATAISSRPRRAGSFPEYGWRGTPEAGLGSKRTTPTDLRLWAWGWDQVGMRADFFPGIARTNFSC